MVFTLRKLILYSAMSLNGKISRADGSVDWLESIPNPDQLDYGYGEFIKTIGTTIQGGNTYRQLIGWDVPFPYPDTENFVFTRKVGQADTEFVRFISDHHVAFTQELKEKAGKNIWLIGGGQINTLLLNAGLIDELHLHVMPLVLPDGVELFEGTPDLTHFALTHTRQYPAGVLELRYTRTGD
ncbi:dihydrofolate reductase [Lewinella sp. W8]|nr:dihydrofolate reductase [Lewinella sp. W8]